MMVKSQDRTLKLQISRIKMHFSRTVRVPVGERWKNLEPM